jgi:hypothetical protein
MSKASLRATLREKRLNIPRRKSGHVVVTEFTGWWRPEVIVTRAPWADAADGADGIFESPMKNTSCWPGKQEHRIFPPVIVDLVRERGVLFSGGLDSAPRPSSSPSGCLRHNPGARHRTVRGFGGPNTTSREQPAVRLVVHEAVNHSDQRDAWAGGVADRCRPSLVGNQKLQNADGAYLLHRVKTQLAHRVNLRQRSNSVAFGAKRT